MNNRIFTFIVLIFLAHIDLGFGYEFVLEGNVKYQLFSPRGQVIAEQDSSFIFKEKDCNWFVKCIPNRFVKFGKEQPLYAYQLASSDGTNFYELESLLGLPNPAKPFVGAIGPGTDPFGLSDPRLTILWYAFGSSCYFAHLNSNLVNPPTANTGEQTYARDFRVQALWQIESNPPFLPQAIFFYRTNVNTYTVFTNAFYNVHEFKTMAGLLLPKAISMQYFFSGTSSNKLAAWTTADMEIEVTNFQGVSSNESFTINVPGSALLSDLRTISPATPFGVAEASQHWPDLASSKSKAKSIAYSMANRLPDSDKNVPANRIIVTRIFLILFLITPLAVIWYQKHKNNKQNENK